MFNFISSAWYSVAIKKPVTTEYLYWNSYDYPQKTQFLHGININTWIQQQFGRTGQKWTNWIVYNDQLHKGLKECGFLKGVNNSGHCKGILVWNNKKIGWLIHSIPKFPASPFVASSIGDIGISSGELKFAQSMIYIELPVKYKVQLVNQVAMMDAQLYEFNGDATITEASICEMFGNTKRKSTAVMRLPFWNTVYHCAKNRNYCRDFYENIVCLKNLNNCNDSHYTTTAPSTTSFRRNRRNAVITLSNNDSSSGGITSDDKIPILCETWTNGEGQRLENTSDVTNLTTFAGWKSTCDHSKWAISIPKPVTNNLPPATFWTCCYNSNGNSNVYRVCIGDLNHMSSQMLRGGGGIIIDGNKALWSCFYSLSLSS